MRETVGSLLRDLGFEGPDGDENIRQALRELSGKRAEVHAIRAEIRQVHERELRALAQVDELREEAANDLDNKVGIS